MKIRTRGDLARGLFDSEAGEGARVLLLSATPYRGLSLYHEADDDHYGDFLALLALSGKQRRGGLQEILAEYRAALPAVMTPDGLARLRTAKTALQQRLCRVMARTETSRFVKRAGRHASRCASGRTIRFMPSMSVRISARRRRRRGGAGGRCRILEVGALLIQLHGLAMP